MSLQETIQELVRESLKVKTEARVLFYEMHALSPRTVREALDRVQRETSPDRSAGIFIAPLDQEHPVQFNGRPYHLYGARVLAEGKNGDQPYVTPHLHLEGDEPYYFISGAGEMNIGQVDEAQNVRWEPPKKVRHGDEVLIRERQVHSFRNVGKRPVDFVFACPPEHLIDHDDAHLKGDRYVVSRLPGGIPGHFKK